MKDREFQIFVKPVSSQCNLRCRYCYYLEKKRLYPAGSSILMDDDTIEKFVIQNIQASTGDLINFSWHGGEPLLAGIDFYRKAVNLQQKHVPEGKIIINGIQTNGTLLSEEWCEFLASEKFVVGISIDGPAEFHNKNRRTVENGYSFKNVINGYNLLQQYGVVPEILCVVNSVNVKYPLAVYNLFKQLDPKFITFLPLVEQRPRLRAGVSENSVSPDGFGHFLSTIFDEWVEKDIGEIKIQIFEEAARTAFNQEHTLCIFKENCGAVPVVELNGDFYSCDHYVEKEHLLGNINEHDLAYFLDSKEQHRFGQNKSAALPRYCLGCGVLKMCNGECPKNRFMLTPDGKPGLNYLCNGYKYFFNHCRPFVEAIAMALQGGNQLRNNSVD
jgi:uncharacterized protein